MHFFHLVRFDAHGFRTVIFLIKSLALDVCDNVEDSSKAQYDAPRDNPGGALSIRGKVVHGTPSLKQ